MVLQVKSRPLWGKIQFRTNLIMWNKNDCQKCDSENNLTSLTQFLFKLNKNDVFRPQQWYRR